MVRMEDDETAGQSAGTGAQSGTEGTSTTSTTTTEGTGTQSGTESQATVTRAEFDQIRNQLRAADQRRDAAEKEAQKLKDAQLSEGERQVKELNETKAQNAELQGKIKQLQIENAFVTDNKHDWHDARAALKLADLSGVEISDDGTVKGLKEALEAVAKSAPYLLKSKTDAGTAEAEKDKGKETNGNGVTGVGGGANGASGNDTNALLKRFPQLAGRVS
jgi:chromosome segregation ATPase